MVLTSLKYKRFVLIISLILLAIMLVLLVALKPFQSESQASAMSPLSSKFGVLRPISDKDLAGLPERTQSWLDLVSRPASARGDDVPKVGSIGEATLPSGTATIAEVGESICILSASGASTCGGSDLASSGRLFVAVPHGCTGSTVFGVVPDGVKALKVESGAGGKSTAIQVSGNVYEAELPANEVQLSFDDSKLEGEVVLPLDAYAKMAGEGCS